MTVESTIYSVVGALCASRVYPDVAPTGTARPYVVYQQVGGQVLNPIDGSAPGDRHARVQVNVWAATRIAATTLMQQIEDAMRPAPAHGRPVGALIARYDEHSELRGAQQDFTFWHT